jgi:hypothetical protein
MIATASTDRRELARRANDGIEVALFWSMSSNQVTIGVLDTRTDEALEFEVDGKLALDAFRHPYAYASSSRDLSVVTPGAALAR